VLIRDAANSAIAENGADTVDFGCHFLANPNLAKRFQCAAELNVADLAIFYTPGTNGYGETKADIRSIVIAIRAFGTAGVTRDDKVNSW
jgi:2,4-dienoyl-CoA reductase-like NADH-dependent reductase (Old Yellow Enzyme family)